MKDTGAPARKRKATTRSRTGCKPCRQLHIKCYEGPVTSCGKVLCRRCWETDTACCYPATGTTKRRRRSSGQRDDDNWVAAVPVVDWPGDGTTATRSQPTLSPQNTLSSAISNSTSSTISSTFTPTPSAHITLLPDLPDALQEWDELFPGMSGSDSSPSSDEQAPAPAPAPVPAASPQGLLAALTAGDKANSALVSTRDSGQHFLSPTISRAVSEALLARADFSGGTPLSSAITADMGSRLASELFRFLVPSPGPAVRSWSLASLAPTPTDRVIVSYFEREGCEEIVAAISPKVNWIYSQLFPRLLTTLLAPSDGGVGDSLRPWLSHSMLYLSYVHRGNVEPDAARSAYCKNEGRKWRNKANMALLKTKLRYTLGEWKTEEYLMGFFVQCMADLLDGKRILIDSSTVFERPETFSSQFTQSLWDMIATYATHIAAFAPLAPDSVAPIQPYLDLPQDGPDWVNVFFGYSRKVISLVHTVNAMVKQRQVLLRRGADNSPAGVLLRAEAEALVLELSKCFHEEEGGLASRVRRGNEIVRSALRVVLMCELLEVDMDDRRVHLGRTRMMELIADTEPTATGGYHWPLTLVAIYTRDHATRARCLEMMRGVLAFSFGQNYRGSEESLGLCWEILDADGRYQHGIAPWRETMHAVGRNLWF